MILDVEAKRGKIGEDYLRYKNQIEDYINRIATIKSDLAKMKLAMAVDDDFAVEDENVIQAFIDEIGALKL